MANSFGYPYAFELVCTTTGQEALQDIASNWPTAFAHSIGTGALVGQMLHDAGCDPAVVQRGIVSAGLHDLGKGNATLAKMGDPTKVFDVEQRRVFTHEHAQEGGRLLTALAMRTEAPSARDDLLAAAFCAEHHHDNPRHNGREIPPGGINSELTLATQILDIYHARVRDPRPSRRYKEGRDGRIVTVGEVLQDLEGEYGDHLTVDGRRIAFIDWLGALPILQPA